MAGRFPGARNLAQFWHNLSSGVESIRSLSDAELLAAGVSQADLTRADYVKRASALDDVPMFDAAFFGLSPRDASIMDPQHRHFLECAWEALEDAAQPPQRFNGSIGMFAGSGMNSYLIHNLLANSRLLEEAGLFQLKQTGNDKDVLATRVSYQFDLRGPSINVQTACSTSLVAVHLACQSLLNFECDMALAGGVTIEIPHGQGYIYRQGEILARDGHCRPFDAASTGTVFASGAGVVVLRRLEDALADRDNIRAVIRGSAINNDGARKVGYLAPSVEGQAEVIAEALEVAEVTADEISYVETHGTGTLVGDPIEVRALTQAFRRTSQRVGTCAIGSLKSNVGHLDAAAGVASLIKTVLALEHAKLPASLHFEQPNPHIDFRDSPFFVNSKLADWSSNGTPRRAGVTALGIGGTNAHVVLEEAPHSAATSSAKPYRLLTVSAKTGAALERGTENLLTYLDAQPELNLADVSWTCQMGRHEFPWRRAFVADTAGNGLRTLSTGGAEQIASGFANSEPHIVFLLSGQGSQYVNMGRELYQHEPVFRDNLDKCASYLLEPLGLDLRAVLYPSAEGESAAAAQLNQTGLTQPALFAVEYSLAQWWISLGIKAAALLGHSIGEYVAACLAGVFKLEDALSIVSARARLMQHQRAGAMLAVSLAPGQVRLGGCLSLAAINSHDQCVVSGPTDEIRKLQHDLDQQSIACRRLSTSHAFHSAMMDPMLAPFEAILRNISYQPPKIPYLSNLTGTWITAGEATDPAYWLRHLRSPVQFSECLANLSLMSNQVMVEVGPGDTLSALARHQGGATVMALQSLPHPRESSGALRYALQTLGQLWTLGAKVDWSALHAGAAPRRVSLPTYPFEHQEFWIEPNQPQVSPLVRHASPEKDGEQTSLGELLLYARKWQREPSAAVSPHDSCCWLLFKDGLGLADQIAANLIAKGDEVVLISAGPTYEEHDSATYTLSPDRREDYDALISALVRSGRLPKRILHLWSVSSLQEALRLDEALALSFLSPMFLAQALGSRDLAGIDIALVSNSMQQVSIEGVQNPVHAMLLGPARVMPLELPGIECRSIDVDLSGGDVSQCADQILAEILAPNESKGVALRGGERFIETLMPLTLPDVLESDRIQPGRVYVITGGLGGMGLIIAAHLAREFQARLVLIGRTAVPPEAEWTALLSDFNVGDAERMRLKKLIEIKKDAGALLVVQGDVTDLEQMQSVVSLTMKTFGKIDGVLHAAGVLEDGPLMLKTPESAARVLAPKVLGTLVLEEALRDVPVRDFVLFSSISSIDPPAGQIDYAAANAFLDAFALSRQGPFRVINWGAWRGVGMAAARTFHHPLLDERILDTPAATVDASVFSPSRQWVLREHAIKQGEELNAILPGTASMEMAAAAFAHTLPGNAIEFQAMEFHDVFFVAPLMLRGDEDREVRIQLRRDAGVSSHRDAFRFSMFSRTSAWVEHSSGIISGGASPVPPVIDRLAISVRCTQREVVFDDEHRTRQERHLVFGPRWHSLRSILIGKDEALAEVQLEDQFLADTSNFLIHPALLDLATGASFYLTADYEHCNDLFLPVAYKRLRVYHPLPAKLYSHTRARKRGEGKSDVESFDITIFDGEGRVLAEIEEFSARRIADAAMALQPDDEAATMARFGGEQLIEAGKPAGIDAMQGARELVRILSAKTPRAVIAASEPLDELKARATVPEQPADVPVNAAPIAVGVEETLAQWWLEMLGVDQAGLDDDFFDLGGHSLIAVRLLAKIRRTFRVDLEFGVLFEARSIRKLAGLIRASQTAQEAE